MPKFSLRSFPLLIKFWDVTLGWALCPLACPVHRHHSQVQCTQVEWPSRSMLQDRQASGISALADDNDDDDDDDDDDEDDDVMIIQFGHDP
eukprot:8780295-Karenia_brevis.AAC.1